MYKQLEEMIQLSLARGLARMLGVRVKGAEQLDDIGTSSNPSISLIHALGGQASKSGIRVTPESARRCSAVYKCVRLLSETYANQPLGVYKRLPENGKEPDPKHSLHPLLHDAPNQMQTSFEWREMDMGHGMDADRAANRQTTH